MLYADNANHLGLDADEVNMRRERLSLVLNNSGLATHEIVEASGLCESIGAEIDGVVGCVRPTRKRYAKVLAGCRRIVPGRPISGQGLEKAPGHVTFILLLKGPCSAF